MAAPLDGIRVVELATWMAAPSAAAVLADLGADVVKIEPPGGDRIRGMVRPPRKEGWTSVDEAFHVNNRGKRSVVVAVDTDEGAELVRRLVDGADVFVCNMLPHRQERYGLDADTLLARQPRLVHATLTGYGTEGPEAWRPGYDVTAFFGRSGLSHGLQEGDGPPPHPRPAQGDNTTGLALVAAVLAALRLVDTTGEGQVTEVSLFHTAAWTLATDLASPLIDGRQPTVRARHELITPLSNRYPCGDGRWVVLNMPELHWWPKFCATIDRKEWIDDPRYATLRDRFTHMAELVDGIDEALSVHSRDEWGERFDEAGLIWGPVQSIAELVDDPQAAAAGLWAEIDHEDVGPFRTVAVPMRFRTAEVGPRRRGPHVGEHTREVMADLGYSDDDVDRFLAAGVVAEGVATPGEVSP